MRDIEETFEVKREALMRLLFDVVVGYFRSSFSFISFLNMGEDVGLVPSPRVVNLSGRSNTWSAISMERLFKVLLDSTIPALPGGCLLNGIKSFSEPLEDTSSCWEDESFLLSDCYWNFFLFLLLPESITCKVKVDPSACCYSDDSDTQSSGFKMQ